MMYADEFLASLEAANFSPKTIVGYRSILFRFEREMTITDPTLCDSRVIDGFLMRLARAGCGAGWRAGARSALASFYRFLRQRKLVLENPCDFVAVPTWKRPPIDIFTPDEIHKMIFQVPPPKPPDLGPTSMSATAHAVNTYCYFRDTAVLSCLYYLGLRASEPGGLLVSDFSERNSRVRVRGKKATEYVSLQIRDKFFMGLKTFMDYRRKIGDDRSPLFPAFFAGTPLDSRDVGLAVARRVKKAGIIAGNRRLSPHTFRYSLASHLCQRGMPVEKIQAVMRHASIETTMRYIEAVRMSEADEMKRRLLSKDTIMNRLPEVEMALAQLPDGL